MSNLSLKKNTGLLIPVEGYRGDIDGLRSIAVISVIVFHLGYLPNGFLGVDVFFVISGYLITKIIFTQCAERQFSLINFYLRRTRRIIPLVCAVDIVVLMVGMIVMLPNDLEKLAQSIIATNLFSNNILQLITTGNYWDVINEYKPMMHTWSLGLEEQYYLLYPLIFLPLGRGHVKILLSFIGVMTVISLVLCFLGFPERTVFYLLPFRFFELSLGGIAAVLLGERVIKHRFTLLPLLLLILVLTTNIYTLSAHVKSLITVVLTLVVLVSNNKADKVATALLENRLMIGVGLISFSLYMWHQPVLSFARYFMFEHIGPWQILLLLVSIIGISILSYYLVEQPFRDKKKIRTRTLLIFVSTAFLVTNAVSFWIYKQAGIIRDVPELEITTAGEKKSGLHSWYNDRIYDHRKDFSTVDKIKIMVMGNSFARDWANVLLESKYARNIEISYFYPEEPTDQVRGRLAEADIVFINGESEKQISENFKIDMERTWIIGTKNFGESNGYFYNHSSANQYSTRVKITQIIYDAYVKEKQLYSKHYIDLIAKVSNDKQTVPVYTPGRLFISQDCRHFTRGGAEYFAQLVDQDLDRIIGTLLANRSIIPER